MDTKEQEKVEYLPASLGRALKKGFADAWDRLGLVVAASLIWFLAAMGPIAIGAALQSRTPGGLPVFALAGLVVAVIISTPVLGGVFRMAQKVVYRDDPSLTDLSAGFREMLPSSYGLVALNIVIVAILALDAAFFFGILGPLRGNLVFFALGALCLYAILAWAMAAMYQFPILAAQGPLGQRRGVLPAAKKSLIIAAHNPWFTIGLFVVILAVGVLCIVSVIGLLMLYAGVLSIVLTHALRELYVRYGVVEEPTETEMDERWKIG